jgi:chromosome segregation ATPase
MNALNRKIEEISLDADILKRHNEDLNHEKHKLQMQMSDKDLTFREALKNVQADSSDPSSQKWLSREQLTRTLQEAEKDLQAKLNAKDKRINEYVQQMRTLVRYAVGVKNVAMEHISPTEPTPEILLRELPVKMEMGNEDAEFNS